MWEDSQLGEFLVEVALHPRRALAERKELRNDVVLLPAAAERLAWNEKTFCQVSVFGNKPFIFFFFLVIWKWQMAILN